MVGRMDRNRAARNEPVSTVATRPPVEDPPSIARADQPRELLVAELTPGHDGLAGCVTLELGLAAIGPRRCRACRLIHPVDTVCLGLWVSAVPVTAAALPTSSERTWRERCPTTWCRRWPLC